jgi:hypothetical protein
MVGERAQTPGRVEKEDMTSEPQLGLSPSCALDLGQSCGAQLDTDAKLREPRNGASCFHQILCSLAAGSEPTTAENSCRVETRAAPVEEWIP